VLALIGSSLIGTAVAGRRPAVTIAGTAAGILLFIVSAIIYIGIACAGLRRHH
jgi:hypothetical protein